MPSKKAPHARPKRAAAAGGGSRGQARPKEANGPRDSTDDPTPGGAPAGTRGARLSRDAVKAATDAAMGASRRAVRVAPIIVQKAASILEEEVAMGIGAAKRIEQRFLDVAALRAQPPDAVMSRFRRDAHEAVDIILDIVTAAATTIGERAGHFINITAGGSPSTPEHVPDSTPEDPGVRLPKIRFVGRVKAGAAAELAISLDNESGQGTTEFSLHVSELVSASGDRIAAAAVTFTPAKLSIEPRSSGKMVVRVRVPEGTPPGLYEGLVRATQLDAIRALLSIEIE